MAASAPENYLVTEVMTATPQKLQLMLIEGALRNVERTRRLWQEGKDEEAGEALIRAQQIISEMLCGLSREVESELARKVASVYIFIFRSLVDAHTRRSESKLDEALSVLETERDTWRQVCERSGVASGPAPEAVSPSVLPVAPVESLDEPPTTGLSLEA